MTNNTAKTVPVVPKTVIGALAEAFGRSFQTIQTWIKDGDDRLTSDRAKSIYAEYGFEWKSKEVLEDQQAA